MSSPKTTDESPLVGNEQEFLLKNMSDNAGVHLNRLASTSSQGSTAPPITTVEVDCGSPVGKLKVYIQLSDHHKSSPQSPGSHKRPEGQQGLYVLTVPDLGCTRELCDSKSDQNFINTVVDHVVQRFYQHSAMAEFNRRTTWIHVIPPGQDARDPDLPANYEFPTFQQIGESLIHVLDNLGIKYCLCFGEGAGANILARFALKYPDRVSGLVLLHCIGSSANFLGSIRERLAASQLDTSVTSTAENFFVIYHFGKHGGDSAFPEVREAMQEFQDHLHNDLNPRNLKQYVNAHIKRSNIEDQIGEIQSPVLFVIGENAYQANAARSFFQSAMEKVSDKRRVELIEVRGVANVLEAAPEKLSESLLLFVQGIGLLSSILGRNRSTSVRMGRSTSMQEADQPAGYYKRTLSRNPTNDSTSSDAGEAQVASNGNSNGNNTAAAAPNPTA